MLAQLVRAVAEGRRKSKPPCALIDDGPFLEAGGGGGLVDGIA
jgi:hypothetical protein